MTSVPGLILTIILTGILLAYSFQRLTVMLYQKNPQIISSQLFSSIDSTYRLRFSDINYKVAWAVEDYNTFAGKDDPSYVHWQVQLTSQIGEN